MSNFRRFLAVLALLTGALLVPGAPASAAGDDNTAIAVNTEDGASLFRLAFSVRRVANGVVDETNAAYALASCADCQTIALAFQVVLAFRDVDVAIPLNRALAYNDQCRECVTYASATQIVLGFDGPVRFTAEGQQRLVALHQTLRSLEERAPTLTVAELNAEVQAAKAELVAILEQELVLVPAAPNREGVDGSSGVNPAGAPEASTTTSAPGATPSTSGPGATATTGTTGSPTTSSTTTTSGPPASSTTTTADPPVSTTTATSAPPAEASGA